MRRNRRVSTRVIVTAFLAGLACLAVRPGWAASPPLAFSASGEITSPSGRISLSAGGAVTLATATGETFTIVSPAEVKGGRTHWNASDDADPQLHVDTAAKEAVFTAKLSDPALPAPIPVRLSLSLTPDGKARIALRYDCAEPIKTHLGFNGLWAYAPHIAYASKPVSVNGQTILVPDGPPQDHPTPLGNATASINDLVFASGDPYRAVHFHVVKGLVTTADDENVHNWHTIGMRIEAVQNAVVLDIDLPEKAKPLSAETYAGIDFYAAERLHLPQYALSRNLVQNPGFENGFQYWNFGNLGKDDKNRFPDNYLIDATAGQARSGGKCVRILGEKDEAPALLSSFAIPVTAGKEYTLSFYARGERPGVSLTTCLFPSTFQHGLAWKDFPLTSGWKRYSYSFTAPGAALSVQFGISRPSEDCVAYLDDVQLEEGPLTDFTRKPLELVFATDHRDNVFAPGQPSGAHWELHGAPHASGTISLTLRDEMGSVLKTHTAAYTLDAKGFGQVAAPLPATGIGQGFYIMEAKAATGDGFSVREYGRLTVAPRINPAIRHHTLFATGGTGQRHGSWDRLLAHLKYFGIGSAINFDPPSHEHLTAMARADIVDVTSIFEAGDHFGDIKLKNGWDGPDSDLPIIEQKAYEKAKAYPEIRYWKLVNEPGGRLTADAGRMKRWIVALSAAYRGIKRANPSARVISIDPANMQPTSGIAMLDNFLTCGGGAICDIMAIHPYRDRPEDPDIDPDIATLLAMLARHGFHGEVWFTEGGGHLGVHNPALGLDVHKALSAEENGGSWRIGNFSYDIGDGERFAAAYAVRAWLAGLKYGDRVKQQVDWYYGSGTIDYDATPEMRAVALDTLASLLGDADFLRDIPLSADARCYLFRDAQARPVAVVWSHDIQHETSSLPAPIIHLGPLAKAAQVFDITGTQLKTNEKGDITVTPFPTYIRLPAGSEAKLAATITNGFETSTSGSVIAYAQVKDREQVGIDLRNTLAKTIKGVLSVTRGHQPAVSKTVSVEPGKTAEVAIPYRTPPNGIGAEDVTIRFASTGGGTSAPVAVPAHIESLMCPSVRQALPLGVDLTAWKAAGANVFPVPQRMIAWDAAPPWVGPKDLSATFAVAYGQGMLYLGFDVADDVFAAAATVEKSWQGDGIQIYFDPWNTGHALAKHGFDDDDQELDIWPQGNRAVVYRAVKPALQVAFTKLGIVDGVKSSLVMRHGGYTVELAIPEEELAPLNLKPGTVFGFSFILNDNDGEGRKRGLTLTPNGTEPYQRPDLYPSLVLGQPAAP